MKKGLLVGLTVVALVILGGCSSNSASTENNNTMTASDYLALDERSWDQFENLYDAHNKLIHAIQAYDSWSISSLDFYAYCQDAEQYFRDQSLRFDYGKNEEENTYLSAFRSWALSDQIAAQKLMDYLESGNISDLNAARDNINDATDAVSTIANNRGVLLVKAGLSNAEIQTKVENDMQELDALAQSGSQTAAVDDSLANISDEEMAYMVDATTTYTEQPSTASYSVTAAENNNQKAATAAEAKKTTTTNTTTHPANTATTENDLVIYNSSNLKQALNSPDSHIDEQVTVGGIVVDQYYGDGKSITVVEPKGYANKYVLFYADDTDQNKQNVSIGDKVIMVGTLSGSDEYDSKTVPSVILDSCIGVD